MRRSRTDEGLPGILWLLLVSLWLTWSPFELRSGPAVLTTRLSSNVIDVIGNLGLLAPLAAAWYLDRQQRTARLLVSTLVVAVTLEVGQMLVEGRVLSVFDPLLNACGAWLSVLVVQTLLRSGFAPSALRAAVASTTYGAIAIFFLVSGTLVQRDLRLADWEPAYGVKVGDEYHDDRRYEGDVWDARICTRPTDSREGICIYPGAPESERRLLVRDAELSQEVAVEASAVARSPIQRGPARIVTFSRDAYHRNLTLAQENSTLVLRLRMPRSGENGDELEFHLPNAVGTNETTRVRAAYRHGAVRMSAESALGGRSGEFTVGPLNAWILTPVPIARDYLEPWPTKLCLLAGALVLIAPLGAALRRLRAPRPHRVRFAAATVAVAIVVIWSARTDPTSYVLASVALLGGVLVQSLAGRRERHLRGSVASDQLPKR